MRRRENEPDLDELKRERDPHHWFDLVKEREGFEEDQTWEYSPRRKYATTKRVSRPSKEPKPETPT